MQRAKKTTAIGIDLGGTRVKGVIINSQGEIIEQQYHDFTGDQWRQVIVQTVDSLRKKAPGMHLIGISAPGIPDPSNRCIAYMPGRLAGLEGLNWSNLLSTPALVVNDAIAALAAEAKFGAALDVKHAVLLTLGTGVGGAIMIDGKIYQGAFQKAGHAGHISVDHDGEPDITGMPGSLEDAIGNCTIYKRSCGRYEFTHQLLADYQKGDAYAQWLWLSSVNKLAVALASITNILSPEVIILGGGISEAGPLLFEPLEKFFSRYEWRAGGRGVRLARAHFGDLSGAIGAAGYAIMRQEEENKI